MSSRSGTGRIALPLAARGCPLKGIELSRAMIAKLRDKEAGTRLDVSIGDMTSVRVDGSFSLVFLVFNTIDNLTSQDAQVACFKNAAAHLGPGGRFLIETQVPPLQKIPFGETARAYRKNANHLGMDEYDVVTQTYTSSHIWLKGAGYKHLGIPFRYAWPAELDLMARLAGMELEYRWSDWLKSPFTHLSESHISVWKKA